MTSNTERPRRRRLRRAVLGLAAVLLLLFLPAVLGPLSLSIPAVRGWLLHRASAAIEDVSGVRMTADDFTIEILAGRLTLLEPVFAAGDADPFLTTRRVTATFAWGELLDDPRVVRTLEIEGPVLDLDARFPVSESDEPLGFDFPQLTLADGRILKAWRPEEGQWAPGWSAADVRIAGSLVGEQLALEVGPSTVNLVRRAGARRAGARRAGGQDVSLPLAVRGRFSGPLAGPWEVRDLDVRGSDVRLEGGELDFGTSSFDAFRLGDGEAELAALYPELGASHLVARGDFDFRTWNGSASLSLSEVPPRLLELLTGEDDGSGGVDWVDEVLRPVELPSGATLPSFLTLSARFASRPGDERQVTGEAQASWVRGSEQILTARLDLEDGRVDPEKGLDPESFAGRVTARSESLPLDLLEPWLEDDTFRQVAGSVADLEADFSIAVADPTPRGRLDLTWRRGRDTLLTAGVRTLGDGRERSDLSFEADLLPDDPGSRHAAGVLTSPSWPRVAEGRLRDGRFDVDVPDLAGALGALRRRWDVGSGIAGLPLGGPLVAGGTLRGALADPELEAEVTWRPTASGEAAMVTVHAAGRPAAMTGDATAELTEISLAPWLEPWLEAPWLEDAAGTVSGTAGIRGSSASFSAGAVLRGNGLRFGKPEDGIPVLGDLVLEVETDGLRLAVKTGFTPLPPSPPGGREGVRESGRGDGGQEGRVTATADVDIRRLFAEGEDGLIGDAEFTLHIDQAHPLVSTADLEATLRDGTVHVERLDAVFSGGEGSATGRVPLGALDPWIGDVLHDLPVERADGPVEVRFDLPHLDPVALGKSLEVESAWTIGRTAARGWLVLDPARPTAVRGLVSFDPWELEHEEGVRMETRDGVRLELGDGRVAMPRISVLTGDQTLTVELGAALARDWQLGDDPATLVRHLAVDVRGIVDSGLLTPFLAGGVARGPVDVDVRLAGSPERLEGHARLHGPGVSILFVDPYVTRFDAPEIELHYGGGKVAIEKAHVRLNEGDLDFDGTLDLASLDLHLGARLADVRYRVDYGLSAVLDGELTLDLPAEGRGRLGGSIVVEHGVLRRDLDLDREILGILFAPEDLTVSRVDPLDEIDLDLRVSTVEGVSVRNNVADLHVGWTPIVVQGTLATPILRGRLEAEPGGLITAYGQTARIDHASLTFPGVPGAAPELELETTSSIESPALADTDLFTWKNPQRKNRPTEETVTLGLAGFLGDRLTSLVLGGSRRTRFQVRSSYRTGKVFLAGETDPSTELAVTRDLSRQVALGFAAEIRNSQDKTYLLELHNFRRAPRFSAQVFTSSQTRGEDSLRTEGGSVQQSIFFGGGRKKKERETRLRAVRIEDSDLLPEDLDAGRLRRATGFRQGDTVFPGSDFDAEVDLVGYLRRKGYPGAEVEATIDDVGRTRADLRLAIRPGPKTRFEFVGEVPSSALRRSVTTRYRLDFYEPASIDEMKEQMVRILRGRGYLEPQVTVSGAPEERSGAGLGEDGDGPSPRTVTIRSEGGRRVRLDTVDFEGLDSADAVLLRRRVPTQAARIELAAALPAADEALLLELRRLGYPEAAILSRRLDVDGRRLVVVLEPGPRLRVAELRIAGLKDTFAAKLEKELPIHRDDPPRGDLLAASSLFLRDELDRRGFTEARIRAVLEPLEENPSDVRLVFDIEPGDRQYLDRVEFKGLRHTRTSYLRGLTKLEDDSVLDPEEVGEARRLLVGTRLFSSVRTVTVPGEEGGSIVTFEVEEAPRFRFGYGLRWDSEAGAAVVVDAVDRNFLGRGVTVGARGLYSEDARAARLHMTRSNLFGTGLSMETFFELRRETFSQDRGDDFDGSTDTTEGTLQVSLPWRKAITRFYGRWRQEDIFIREVFFDFEVRLSTPIIGWQVVYDTRDDTLNPHRGIFATTDLSSTGDYLGSDFNFLRFFGQVSHFRPLGRLGSSPLTWAQSLRLGVLDSQDEFPLSSELFRSGGEYSVRGYGTDSLESGPPSDFFRGGEALLILNQELRFPLWWELSGVVFVDVGGIWAQKDDFGSDLFTAAGLGLRADTPIGLLRLDFGVPLDSRDGTSSVKTWFGFGHAF